MTSKAWKVEEEERDWLGSASELLSKVGTAAVTASQRVNAGRACTKNRVGQSVRLRRENLRIKREEGSEHTVQATKRRGDRRPSFCFASVV